MGRLFHAIVLAVAFALVATATAVIGSDRPIASSPSEASADDLAQAADFRETFGFDSSKETILRAATDGQAYPDQEWGVPLSQAEAAEMQRRLAVMQSVHPAVGVAQDLGTWGGWWIDQQAAGMPVFQFTGDPRSGRAAIEHALPDGVEVRFVGVTRTLAELEEQQAAITASIDRLAAETGIRVTGVTVDDKGNRVIVSVEELDARAVAVLRQEFGDAVAVEERPVGEADHNCPISDCLPVKGGIGITDQVDAWDCTTGYLARRTDGVDTLVMITAGHCVRLGSTDNPPWEHGENNILTSLTIGGDLAHTWTDDSNADVGITTVIGADIPTVKNLILTDEDPKVERPVELQLSWDLQVQGTPACRMGLTSGRDCGEILFRNRTRESAVAGEGSKTIIGVVVIDEDSQGGDSGGPVYYVVTPASGPKYAVLLGTHVHSDPGYTSNGEGWYSPWDRGIETLEDKFSGLDLVPCLSSSCGF